MISHVVWHSKGYNFPRSKRNMHAQYDHHITYNPSPVAKPAPDCGFSKGTVTGWRRRFHLRHSVAKNMTQWWKRTNTGTSFGTHNEAERWETKRCVRHEDNDNVCWTKQLARYEGHMLIGSGAFLYYFFVSWSSWSGTLPPPFYHTFRAKMTDIALHLHPSTALFE